MRWSIQIMGFVAPVLILLAICGRSHNFFTMAKETTEKKTRTPRDYSSIEKGALSLDLKDRVMLRNNLSLSIESELKAMEEDLELAKKTVNGTQP